MMQSALEDIPGIGAKSIEKLFKKFKSLESIKSASQDELSQEIGFKRASILADHLAGENS